ncbi:hypothetical protein COCCADRAFT_26033 [Bipolaris zeicola 26-R-13]|uniref:Uncharacterized protein n=1 Tax=Cochliobolus carbonum (strain 26-R-13) TaxID=930089 RepID=W6Y876_COCC2|nr:uncharacterized protein COCCADRAFT_26033 [Bipolaris zeicola 26-R-13]EUC33670.1 hypothetical protein COCCADRAFT_26033 [Bipolaris zeicola 26-R-13]
MAACLTSVDREMCPALCCYFEMVDCDRPSDTEQFSRHITLFMHIMPNCSPTCTSLHPLGPIPSSNSVIHVAQRLESGFREAQIPPPTKILFTRFTRTIHVLSTDSQPPRKYITLRARASNSYLSWSNGKKHPHYTQVDTYPSSTY